MADIPLEERGIFEEVFSRNVCCKCIHGVIVGYVESDAEAAPDGELE